MLKCHKSDQIEKVWKVVSFSYWGPDGKQNQTVLVQIHPWSSEHTGPPLSEERSSSKKVNLITWSQIHTWVNRRCSVTDQSPDVSRLTSPNGQFNISGRKHKMLYNFPESFSFLKSRLEEQELSPKSRLHLDLLSNTNVWKQETPNPETLSRVRPAEPLFQTMF